MLFYIASILGLALAAPTEKRAIANYYSQADGQIISNPTSTTGLTPLTLTLGPGGSLTDQNGRICYTVVATGQLQCSSPVITQPVLQTGFSSVNGNLAQNGNTVFYECETVGGTAANFHIYNHNDGEICFQTTISLTAAAVTSSAKVVTSTVTPAKITTATTTTAGRTITITSTVPAVIKTVTVTSTRSSTTTLKGTTSTITKTSTAPAVLAPVTTIKATTAAAPVATTKATTVVAPVATTKATTVVAPVATIKATTVVAPVATTKATTVVAPVATTKATTLVPVTTAKAITAVAFATTSKATTVAASTAASTSVPSSPNLYPRLIVPVIAGQGAQGSEYIITLTSTTKVDLLFDIPASSGYKTCTLVGRFPVGGNPTSSGAYGTAQVQAELLVSNIATSTSSSNQPAGLTNLGTTAAGTALNGANAVYTSFSVTAGQSYSIALTAVSGSLTVFEDYNTPVTGYTLNCA